MDATTKSKEILFLPIAINLEKMIQCRLKVIKSECRSPPHLEIGSQMRVTFNIEIGTVWSYN